MNCVKSILDKYPSKRFLVIVPTTALRDQWTQQIDLMGFSLNGEAMVINSAIKKPYRTDILILDEGHRYCADDFSKVFKTIEYKYILSLTATFERLDGKHELLEKYCPVIDKITTEEALLNGWISTYKEYQVLIDVDDIDEYKEYNKEFTKAFEFFNYDFSMAMKMLGKDGLHNRIAYRDQLCGRNASEEDKKNTLKTITYYATSFIRSIQNRKTFINNHPKKIEIARKIIEARPNAKIITFSNNVKMAESIGYGSVYTGKITSKKKSRMTLEEFAQQSTGVINSVAKLNEGIDVKGLSVAIILGLDSSETKSVQRRGRIIRKEGSKIAEIFNIIIDQTVELKWFQSSHKNSQYITIDEEGLDEILAGNIPKPYTKKIKDFTFRY